MFKLFIGFVLGFFIAVCVLEPSAAKHMLGSAVDTVHTEAPKITGIVVDDFGKINR